MLHTVVIIFVGGTLCRRTTESHAKSFHRPWLFIRARKLTLFCSAAYRIVEFPAVFR